VLIAGSPTHAGVEDPYYLCGFLTALALDRLRSFEPGLELPSFQPELRRLVRLKEALEEREG
jgi:hypothetical protein